MRLASLLVAASMIAPKLAVADTAADATALFKQAQGKYEKGEYRAAIKLFDDAYRLVHDPVYLFNIAQSYRKLFDCVPASQFFKRYLAEATDADSSQRTKVQQWIDELAPCVSEHATATKVIPKPTPKPAVAPVIDHGRGYRIAGLSLIGVGAVGLVVGTLFGKRGSDIEAELAADCGTGCVWTADHEQRDHDGARANLIAGISWIAGGAAVAGGVVLYIVGRSRRTERITIVPVAAAGTGAAVQARLRF